MRFRAALSLIGFQLVLPSLGRAQVVPQSSAPIAAIHHGRSPSALDVRLPRVETPGTLVIDGRLEEPEWRTAALLTGFTSYRPVDGREAPDSTDVLVWYSPTAIHIGVRAYEPHGPGMVRATLAERDKVTGDDNVEIYLDTFHELRRAHVFVVNPLGVQADGTKTEGVFVPGSAAPGETDFSPDFIWDSKGRLTETGYEVEIRIPFSSLRYPGRGPDTWGFNVMRVVRHSGWEMTWAPTRRGNASFIAQSGRLVDLHGLRHRQSVELIPELRTRVAGAADAAGQWRYDNRPELGGNVRWALTSNFSLNAAIKPDFSQVEADAAQIAADPRFDVFYLERRPFFVDGIEKFIVPNSLVYTRRIVNPVAAGKLTGTIGRTDVAAITAVDADHPGDTQDAQPAIGIVRVSHALRGQSTVSALYTDRRVGSDHNRVAGFDSRIVFKKLYFVRVQAVSSDTRAAGQSYAGPMWEAVVDRTGRRYGFHYAFMGIDPQFDSKLGFVSRRGFVKPMLNNRFAYYGQRGALIEAWNAQTRTEWLWRYDDFFHGKHKLEEQYFVDNKLTLRGGWSVGVIPRVARFAFDPTLYRSLVTIDPSGASTAFTVSPRRTVTSLNASLATPRWQRFSALASLTGGRDVDFTETSAARRIDGTVSTTWRPTSQMRIDVSYLSSRLTRLADDVTTASVRIPRVKTEYQITRPLFVRFVAQYEARRRAAPADWRTGNPLGTATSSGVRPIAASTSNDLRADWLVSYRPTPGTVFFIGYGSSMTEDDPLRFDRLRRVSDGVFMKASYLFR